MKKMSKGMLMTALICGAVYLGGSPVYANELQEFSLDEYVVTAARTETKLVDTPANISVVDAKTIEERHYQDVSEVLKDVPGANVMDSGSGAYEKAISLNGDSRVLVLVDGRKVHFASGTSSGAAGYDMNLLPDVNLIDRIEVLKGAGGALYGSDAVGGVINIITKKADRNYGKVSIGIGSRDTKDLSVIYSIKSDRTGVTLSASQEKQGYYKYKDFVTDNVKRWKFNSEMESEKVSLHITQDFDNYSNLEIGYDYSKFEGYTTNYIGNYNLSFNEKETQNVYAKLNWYLNDTDHGYIQIYHNEYDYYSINSITSELYGDIKEKTKGIDLQQSISLSNTNKMILGTSWRDSEVDNKNMYDDGVNNIAFFINDTWEITPTWLLNAGLRYDDHSKVGNETTFSAGLNKKFDENSHAYINWGEVFRVPTTGDLFNPDGGNPNLKPETGDTWTIGYSTNIANSTDLNVNYFESDLEDAIDWTDTGIPTGQGWNYFEVRNVYEQKKKGFELNINHKLNNNVDLVGSYTYINVKNNTGNGFVKDWNYLPNTFRFGINYHEGKWDTNLWLRAGTGGATHTYDHNYDGYNGFKQSYLDNKYWTVDIAVTYKATKDLSFYAKGYNLFNEAYADYAGVNTYTGEYKYPAQSRRFIVGAEYKF